MDKISKSALVKVRIHIVLTEEQILEIKRIAEKNDSNCGREMRRILAAGLREEKRHEAKKGE